MSNQEEQIARAMIDLVVEVIDEFSEKLISIATAQEDTSIENVRHQNNFLSLIDIELHRLYRQRIAQIIPSFIFVSEEGDVETISVSESDEPQYVVIVDPLDTSDLAVRGLNGYTHVAVFSKRLCRPIVAIVGDIFHSIAVYYAIDCRDGVSRAYMRTRGGSVHELRTNQKKCLDDALVTNYSMEPGVRFRQLAQQFDLIEALASSKSRIGVDFGSIGFCHVASGASNAFIEFAKGFWLWDWYAGRCILEAAGGAVIDPDGSRLPLILPTTQEGLRAELTKRRKFVAAGSIDLAKSLLMVVNFDLESPVVEKEV